MSRVVGVTTALVAGASIGGRYRLSAPLGAGSQGAVWEAVDLRDGGALVALKFAAADGILASEGRLLLSLAHRALPRARDLGIHGDLAFLATERIAARPITGEADARTTFQALVDVAEALAALHSAGIVHGDVKPANVLAAGGRAWLVDLGLATRAGIHAPAGTLACLAPESLVGERSPGTDLYALGVTAALVLAHAHPLVDDARDRVALLAALGRGASPRASVIDALPPPLRAAIAGLLAPDRASRPRSARVWLARVARDAAAWLRPDQRARALDHDEAPVSAPLVAREDVIARVAAALESALASGAQTTVVCVYGPAGCGRRAVLDAALRALRVAAAARGAIPELLDMVPDDPTRPSLVRCVDAAPGVLVAMGESIERRHRHGDLPVPIVVAATSASGVHAPGVVSFAIGPLDEDGVAALVTALASRAPTQRAVRAVIDATGGLPASVLAFAARVGTETLATLEPGEIAWTPPSADSTGLDADAMRLHIALTAHGGRAPLHAVRDLAEPVAFGAAIDAVVERAIAVRDRDGLRVLVPFVPSLASTDAVAQVRGNARAVMPTNVVVAARLAGWDGDRTAQASLVRQLLADPTLGVQARAEWLAVIVASAPDDPDSARELASLHLRAGRVTDALRALAPLSEDLATCVLRTSAWQREGDAAALAEFVRRNASDETLGPVATLVEVRRALDAHDGDDARTRLDALGPIDDLPVELLARARELAVRVAMVRDDEDDVARTLALAESHALRLGDGVARARLRSLAGMHAQMHGRFDVARRAYADAWALATEEGDVHAAATYAVNLGTSELDAGGLAEARHWLTRGTRALVRLGRMGELARAEVNLASLALLVGDRATAAEHADRAERAAREAADPLAGAFARVWAAEARFDGAALGSALETAARDLGTMAPSMAAEVFARAALAYANAGIPARARSLAGDVARAPESWRELVALEVEHATGTSAAALRERCDHLVALVASEVAPSIELDLLARRLATRIAMASDDAVWARTARRALDDRIDTLAARVPEGLAALLRDRYGLPTPSVPPADLLPLPRDHARWRRLAAVTREINAEGRLRPLLERVMDAVVELTGASRGFLLLAAPDGTLTVRTARNVGRRDLATDDLSLSRSVAEQVARTGEAIVTVDASTDARLDAFASVHAMQLRSILAVPLLVHGRPCGTVYVDDRYRTNAFGDEALEIVREFADAAALAIHNARTASALRRALRRAERLATQLSTRVEEQSVKLEAMTRALGPAAGETRGRYEAIVGRGPAMLRTLQLIDKVAATTIPVLLTGESGTGKELLARALHANSPRASRPFVAENCGAIPETLLESALFGHVKGAFTGADRARAGLFEVADGGTLFLDEIGEMPLAMQSRLLRVLQGGEVRPVGGDQAKRVDVRVVAATNRDLVAMVRDGRFREDLFYRLAVMVVPVPSLRDRREDIGGLVAHFVARGAAGRTPAVERRALARLVAYDWPGNVRQLENEIARASVLCDGTIRDTDLSPTLTDDTRTAHGRGTDEGSGAHDLRRAVDELERRCIERAMREHDGNQSQAARTLGLSRFGLQKKLKRLGLDASALRRTRPAIVR